MKSREAHPANCIHFVDVRGLLMHFDSESLSGVTFQRDYTWVFQEFGYAASFAFELVQSVENSYSAFAMVYSAYDLRREPQWSPDNNKLKNCWNFELRPQDFAIFEAQPISPNDQAEKMGDFYIVDEFRQPEIDFVPRPHFAPPADVEELRRNLELYLRYRAGEERGNIPHLRRFLFFKGFDKGTKEAAAKNLLEKIDNPSKELSPRDKAALNNGLLREAVRGYQTIMLRRLVRN